MIKEYNENSRVGEVESGENGREGRGMEQKYWAAQGFVLPQCFQLFACHCRQ